MKLLPPNGNDIAQLFLLCMPPNALKEFDLSEKNKDAFTDHFNSADDYFKNEIIALALYYANRNIVQFTKSYSIVRSLNIPPEVIHSLVQLVRTEEFSETERLLTEIEKDKKSKATDKGHTAHRILKERAIQYYRNNHKTFKNKDDAAFHMADKIVPAAFSTIRGWLKGVKPE
jgi:lysyl-tRNA synthetase class I